MKESGVGSEGKREVAFPGFAVDTDTTVIQILTAACLSVRSGRTARLEPLVNNANYSQPIDKRSKMDSTPARSVTAALLCASPPFAAAPKASPSPLPLFPQSPTPLEPRNHRP